MKKRAIFVLGMVFVFSSFAFAQTKVVTNADLEKFRQKRLKAEKELRENYQELGFPSPEEMERREEKSRREKTDLANELREKRLVRENQPVYNYYPTSDTQNYSDSNRGFVDYGRYYSSSYFYNGYRNRRYYRGKRNHRYYRNRDFRQRFINRLPGFVLRNHRFNRIDTNRNQHRVRRGFNNHRRGTRIGIRINR